MFELYFYPQDFLNMQNVLDLIQNGWIICPVPNLVLHMKLKNKKFQSLVQLQMIQLPIFN